MPCSGQLVIGKSNDRTNDCLPSRLQASRVACVCALVTPPLSPSQPHLPTPIPKPIGMALQLQNPVLLPLPPSHLQPSLSHYGGSPSLFKDLTANPANSSLVLRLCHTTQPPPATTHVSAHCRPCMASQALPSHRHVTSSQTPHPGAYQGGLLNRPCQNQTRHPRAHRARHPSPAAAAAPAATRATQPHQLENGEQRSNGEHRAAQRMQCTQADHQVGWLGGAWCNLIRTSQPGKPHNTVATVHEHDDNPHTLKMSHVQ